MRSLPWFLVAVVLFASSAQAYPEQGAFELSLNSTQNYGMVVKNVYNSTRLFIKVSCSGTSEVKIGWLLRETNCWNEYAFLSYEGAAKGYYDNPNALLPFPSDINETSPSFLKVPEETHKCSDFINLPPVKPTQSLQANEGKGQEIVRQKPKYTVDHDGNFLFVIFIKPIDDAANFVAKVDVSMQGDHGYLSIVDYPLLPFYGVMCGIYVIMGVAWLIVSANHWRDLLRIQFWIGGVIFLGMLEKAMFFSEYENINSTGSSTTGLILTAEIVSCAKRTLARMLVIIVSLGFGIVKPRLGPTLHRVVGIGGLYFVIASSEAWLRIVKPKNDISSTTLFAGIPLAVIDSSICWWVFSALVATTRTLRLRRNVVKLSLYRHFTNTLIFAVISSVIFMLWSIKYHKLEDCLIDWRDLWIDEAFWHLLFSILLIVIMVLWRPSQNNQRYAFTPLLDSEDEEGDEDEEGGFYADAYDTVKMRTSGKTPKGSPKEKPNPEDEDPMKWIEENIPEAGDNPLPVLDSDEELENAKFEISKMQ